MKLFEILAELNIPTAPEHHHHSREGWLQTDCPYCSPGTERWRLGFNEQYFYCNCWSCGRHNIVDALATLSSQSRRDVGQLLSQADRRVIHHEEVKGVLAIPNGVGKLEGAHKRYLKRRGFDPCKLEHLWGIKGLALSMTHPWRIFIPIHYQGEVVSWTTRAISDYIEPRYKSASLKEEKMPHKKLLYGEDFVRQSCVVVEGPIDAWAIGPGAVATCGTGLMGDSQISRIAKYPLRVLCFDNEPDAQRRAEKVCNDLSSFPGKTFKIELESGKDAAEASEKEIRELRKRFLEDQT
jgi:hypothetical protein